MCPVVLNKTTNNCKKVFFFSYVVSGETRKTPRAPNSEHSDLSEFLGDIVTSHLSANKCINKNTSISVTDSWRIVCVWVRL